MRRKKSQKVWQVSDWQAYIEVTATQTEDRAMNEYRISFIVKTDEDPSTLLDCAQEGASRLSQSLESYGGNVEIDEDRVSVDEI